MVGVCKRKRKKEKKNVESVSANHLLLCATHAQTLPTIEVDHEEDHASDPSLMRTATSRLDLLVGSRPRQAALYTHQSHHQHTPHVQGVHILCINHLLFV